jgi:hypothetical protein
LHELAPFLRLVLCLYGVFDKEFAAFAPFFLIFPLWIDRVGFWMALFAGSVVPIFCLYLLNPNIILIESKRSNLLGTMPNLK